MNKYKEPNSDDLEKIAKYRDFIKTMKSISVGLLILFIVTLILVVIRL